VPKKVFAAFVLTFCSVPAFAQAEPTSQPASQSQSSPPTESPISRIFNPLVGVDEYGGLPYEGAQESKYRLYIHGFIRARASATEQDAAAPFVGRNNGFNLAHARLELTAGYLDKLWLRFAVDGAFDRGNGFSGAVAQTGVGNVIFALRDAYIAYQPFQALRFMIGQFRAPFDEEALTSTTRLMFISRSMHSQGVRATEGYFVPGLSPDREIGLRISGEDLHLSQKITANYYVAVTNGNGFGVNANDNNLVAVWARGEIHFPFLRVAAAGFWNGMTFGTYPNLFDEMRYGGTGDLKFSWKHDFGELIAFAEFVLVQMRFTSTGAPVVTQMGAQGQVGYKFFFGLMPAYRLSWLEPNDRIVNDQLLYHTAGLSYDLPWVPLRVLANYTFTGEQPGRSLRNNLFEFLAQAVF
jgi:hypothetical protein